ncbi:hypothetical protein GCM10007420_25910 [Glycocaulis albus]|uniref:Peptidase M1 membrane alanine aminopeptidase domain-containing protein n=1 Tax=Glycocaulis albus TaxID=1382801 RepID=A0ABQ1Y0J8_9PROT|nr:M1 family aminopeptidase [Glycocaulis albus]GGH07921.1 hypothetical protein GCM10007420_25910 [Glycocaulis albus]
MKSLLSLAFIILVPSAFAAVPPVHGQANFEGHVGPDPLTGSLSAEWHLSFIAGEDNTDSVGFLLAHGLDVSSVSGAHVRSHSVSADDSSPFANHQIDLTGIEPGDTVELAFSYAGTPHLDDSGMAQVSPEWIELMLDAYWFPVSASFDQMMTGTLSVELGGNWTVIAGPPAVYEEGIHIIEFTRPHIDVNFAAAPAITRLERDAFSVFHTGAPEAQLALIDTAASDCATYLNARYGQEDGLENVRIVIAPRDEAGYYRPNFISLDAAGFDDLLDAHGLLCHEMAHHWAVTANFNSPHHWMSEAFAEYVTARFVREHHGQEAYDAMVSMFDAAGRDAGPVWSPEMDSRPSHRLMYRKAPYLLSELEAQIGEVRFDAFIHRYMTERWATTEELLAALEAVAGSQAAEAFASALAR